MLSEIVVLIIEIDNGLSCNACESSYYITFMNTNNDTVSCLVYLLKNDRL